MKSCFLIQDNILDKKLLKINSMRKTSRAKKNVKVVIKDVIECFAENFTKWKQRLSFFI
jgi:hypothetical protein